MNKSGRVAAVLLLAGLGLSCWRGEPTGLAGAMKKEQAGDYLGARVDYARLLPGCRGTELEPLVLYRLGVADKNLKKFDQALEEFLDLAGRHADSVYAMWALGEAAVIYQQAGKVEPASNCIRRALQLYKQDQRMRQMASLLADLRAQEMARLRQDNKAVSQQEVWQQLADQVPLFLLAGEQGKNAQVIMQLQSQAEGINRARTYQLSVKQIISVKDAPAEGFPGLALARNYRQAAPDGQKFIYRDRGSDGFYYVFLQENGKAGRRILAETKGARFPVWDRDGQRVLFTRGDKDGNCAIEAVNVASGKVRELYAVGGALGLHVACAAGSGKIGFVYAGDIWVMEGDGMDVRKLTDGLLLPRQAELSWSADGGRIFYTTGQGTGGAPQAGMRMGIIELQTTSG